jgi:hypothetical protein
VEGFRPVPVVDFPQGLVEGFRPVQAVDFPRVPEAAYRLAPAITGAVFRLAERVDSGRTLPEAFPGVANRVIFMDQGQIVEQNEPKEFFNNPRSERTKLFLSQILGH